MFSKSNKHLMHRFMELMNTASAALAEELISPSALFQMWGQSAPVMGPAGYLSVLAMLRSGFPDIRWTLEDMLAEENHVAARFTVRGTHRGTFVGIPATGQTIAVKSVGFYRLLGDQILEEFVQPDLAAYLRSLNQAAVRRGVRQRGADTQAICRNRSSLAFRYASES